MSVCVYLGMMFDLWKPDGLPLLMQSSLEWEKTFSGKKKVPPLLKRKENAVIAPLEKKHLNLGEKYMG